MNLGAFGKSKSPSIGSVTDYLDFFPSGKSSSSPSFMDNIPTSKVYTPPQMTSSVSLQKPVVGPAQIMQPGNSRYQPPAEDSFYGATEAFTPETKSKMSTPVLIVLSLGLIGVLAYATGIVGKATR